MSDLAQRVAAVFNPSNPLAQAHLRGLVPDRKVLKRTSTVNVGGISNSTTTYEVTQTWNLGAATGLVATFSREAFKHKLVKLFKSELQTGDTGFDAVVYVTTDTREATQALLESEAARDAIRALIEDGGEVSIEGERLVVTASSADESTADPGQREIGALLTHLLLFNEASA